jgi:butyrate kinase
VKKKPRNILNKRLGLSSGSGRIVSIMSQERILVINPGSTSTKLAVFDGEHAIYTEVLRHSAIELAPFDKITDQYHFRRDTILQGLYQADIALDSLTAVVGRGGLLKPMAGGTYRITTPMLEDLWQGRFGEHASNLGALIAYDIGKQLNISAFIVDPVTVDEMQPLARLSGLPDFPRRSIFHALNQKATARRAAQDLGKHYEDVNFVVAHLGGGISVGAHHYGRVVDVNNALDGEGPYSPERSGTIPVGDLMRICYAGHASQEEIKQKIVGRGGVVAYLGVNDMREVSRRAQDGDAFAAKIYQGMAYQVAKEIAAASAVLSGKVDAVVITGGIAHDENLVNWIKERIAFIAPVLVYPGEDEMEALALGALRVIRGEESEKNYE